MPRAEKREAFNFFINPTFCFSTTARNPSRPPAVHEEPFAAEVPLPLQTFHHITQFFALILQLE